MVARHKSSPRGDDGGYPIKIHPPTPEWIEVAASALQQGELIGFPTETVYGIAAIATNREAVLKIFDLKGRPSDNPLIVHVSSLNGAESLVSSIPDYARCLASEFWPGPLTLVLPKSSVVPDVVTAGLGTVAVRVPGHPVARAIIDAASAPLSAPSANTFMGLSPTRAENIAPQILAGLACVIDGGPCAIGLESTVVDCSDKVAAILRPGGISREQIEALIGDVSTNISKERRSPGTYRRHYSPITHLRLADSLGEQEAGIVFHIPENAQQIQLPADPAEYGALLYATLFALDQKGLSEIVIERPPTTREWEAVWDRLRKAANQPYTS